MSRIWKSSLVAAIAALTCLPIATVEAGAQTLPRKHYSHRHVASYPVGLSYARGRYGLPRGHGHHYADLVGDPGSGYGFYPLPDRIRVAAYRYHLRQEARPYWDNPVAFAIATDAAGYHGRLPGDFGYTGTDIFSPYDGVGTPFFAGYYGPAGDPEDRPFPFGRPYPPMRASAYSDR